MGDLRNCRKYIQEFRKMCEIGRKWEKKWRTSRQFGTNSPFSPIKSFSFFHSLATFPSRSFDEFDWENGEFLTGRFFG